MEIINVNDDEDGAEIVSVNVAGVTSISDLPVIFKGNPGLDGKDGRDGRDGLDGLPGKDGVDGKDGLDGLDGLPGKDGRDGADAVYPIFNTAAEADAWSLANPDKVAFARNAP